jgi:hypothetical protein
MPSYAIGNSGPANSVAEPNGIVILIDDPDEAKLVVGAVPGRHHLVHDFSLWQLNRALAAFGWKHQALMQAPTKILIGGFLIAAAIVAGGFIRGEIHSSVTDEIRRRAALEDTQQQKCETEVTRNFAIAHGLDPAELLSDRYEIDLITAFYVQCPSGGAADQVRGSARVAALYRKRSLMLALPVALLGAIPWLWYFMLRRLAELRDVIKGNSRRS